MCNCDSRGVGHGKRFPSPTIALFLTGWLHACATAPPPNVTEDGLERADFRGIDLAYVRPGATLTRFERVMIDPVEVSFARNWNPRQTGSRLPLAQKERERIVQEITRLFMTTFGKELERGNGYAVVFEPGPDVLRICAALRDVYVNAPEGLAPGRARTYVTSAGQMTLVAELRDSQTGLVLGRVFDRGDASNVMGGWEMAGSLGTSLGAQRIVADWARFLRARLDVAHVHDPGGTVTD